MTASSNESRINLTRIAHVFYTHREIDKAHHFLLDFGFREVKRVGNDIYYRGTSSEPFVYCARQGDQDGFGGAAFVVESESDLFAATKLPGATGIYDLGNAPGGGRCVTFHDPIDKFPFHLVYGQEAHADEELFPYIYTYNSLIGNLLTFPANRQTPAREQNTTTSKGPCTRAQIGSFRNVCHQFCAGV
ncbi:hypothetical protein AO1008_10928 [Aspergillus oryzae 100-8]|uniref:VOC domain-containing protein n=1 Tax=Aspergillus oryzae (strain 3.042) TaxID=1160506 RepID=I8ITQ4_ASPO3|nr:hypothetical protein Ao3042_11922 [Aspergillus oryzae 3.042]KDE84362.1 hypothetical protein AO1008_10928 [Aspergillus oryzae 100-8]|eukprot:EIT82836.1 hypothetical protein Ao3042_11922 [Aspergillus oryzae 3.042]